MALTMERENEEKNMQRKKVNNELKIRMNTTEPPSYTRSKCVYIICMAYHGSESKRGHKTAHQESVDSIEARDASE